jgi:hypothetical protein
LYGAATTLVAVPVNGTETELVVHRILAAGLVAVESSAVTIPLIANNANSVIPIASIFLTFMLIPPIF